MHYTCTYCMCFSPQIMAGILEKFKEKKLNVVNSLRDAADAVFLTVRHTHTHARTYMYLLSIILTLHNMYMYKCV